MAEPEAGQMKNFLVTGVPGVGKTTLIRNLCKRLSFLNPEGFVDDSGAIPAQVHRAFLQLILRGD